MHSYLQYQMAYRVLHSIKLIYIKIWWRKVQNYVIIYCMIHVTIETWHNVLKYVAGIQAFLVQFRAVLKNRLLINFLIYLGDTLLHCEVYIPNNYV
jgi:hypothetical protein